MGFIDSGVLVTNMFIIYKINVILITHHTLANQPYLTNVDFT